MRLPVSLLLVAALFAGAGCTTVPAGKTAAAPASSAPPDAPATAGASHGRRAVSVYLETGADARPGLGAELAGAAQDELRRRGYEIRGVHFFPAGTPADDTVALLFAPARALAGGTAPDDTLRAATYLHTNSPRLVFVASLQLAAAPAKSGPPGPAVTLSAFLCNTATGSVVWSGSATTAGDTLDAARAPKLAADLLRTAPRATAVKG